MKNYMKPVAIMNDEMMEGVYAGSGDCWTVKVTRDQVNAGGYSTYRVDGRHSTSAGHISTATKVIITFNQPINSASFEGFSVSVSGNTVTLSRKSHANAEYSGDDYNSLLKVWATDLDSLKVESKSIYCTKETSVNGHN